MRIIIDIKEGVDKRTALEMLVEWVDDAEKHPDEYPIKGAYIDRHAHIALYARPYRKNICIVAESTTKGEKE